MPSLNVCQRLSVLWRGRRFKKTPFVSQTTMTDCGAACLAMVLNYYGKQVSLKNCQDHIAPGRDGINAFTILKAGRAFGLRGRGIKLTTLEEFHHVPPATILHWRFMHFVIFERVCRSGIEILDPAFGRRIVDLDEFDESFTGIALSFEPGENFQESGGVSRRNPVLSRYVGRILHSGLLPRVVVTSVLIQLLALSLPLMFAVIANQVIPHKDIRLLVIVGAGALVMTVFHFLSELIRAHLLVYLRTKVDAAVTTDFLEHLVSLPFDFFQKRPAGDLMMRLNANATIRDILTSNMLSGFLDGAMVGVYVILIFVMDLTMGLLVVFLALIRVALYVATQRRNHNLMARSLQVQADSRSYEIQMLTGIETIKASGSDVEAVERWSRLFARSLNVSLAQGQLDAWIQATLTAFQVASPLAVLIYGAFRVVSGEMDFGLALAVYALAMGVLQPLSQLVKNAFQLQRLGSYLDRIGEVFEMAPEQESASALSSGKIKGGISLANMSYRYDPQSPAAVQNISLNVQPGQFVAIVGASGSGKSTLAKLIVGLYRPQSGALKFDSVDSLSFDIRSLRRQIGVVPQYPHLFSGSIRDNICLRGTELPLSRIVEAAKRARIHDDIMSMPMGYDTLLSDGGGSLSGGQRQRVALARALVDRPAVLLLDEATSALDAITEAQVLAELDRMRCTRILIAHRLSTVKDADWIVVLDRGKLVEQGMYGKLIEGEGIFAQLVAGQLTETRGNMRCAAESY